MFKRCLSLILIVIMFSVVFSGITCLAEEFETTDFLLNGGAEWGNASYSCWSGTPAISTDIVRTGTKSFVIATTADNAATTGVLESRQIFYQTMNDVLGSQQYTLTFYLRKEADFQSATVASGCTVLSPGTTMKPAAGMKIEFFNANGAIIGSFDRSDEFSSSNGQWEKFTYTFTTPVNTVSARAQMRSQGIGTMYFDDLSITGPCTAAVKAKKEEHYARMQKGYDMSQYFYNEQQKEKTDVVLSGANYVTHPGFEYSLTFSKYWKLPAVSSYGFTASQATDDKKSGYYSLKLESPAGYSGVNPHAYQALTPPSGETTFSADTTYFVSAWVKTVNAPLGAGAYYDMKLYNAEGNEVGVQSSPITNTNGEWQKVDYVFTMPADITKVTFYIRSTSTGGMTVYYDDVEFGLASSSNPLILKTKHTFYYTDEGNITATATFNTGAASIESGSKIRFSLTDENGTAIATSEVATAEVNEWTFNPLTYMSKATKYILKAEYIDASGNASDEWVKTKNIYLYDRPQTLDKNGNLLDGDIVNGQFIPNGKIVPPFFTYRYGVEGSGRFDEFASAGITVIRPHENITLEFLDELHANGVKALIQLYSPPTGHPTSIEKVTGIVNLVKDHPAVVAYMLMDEPSEHIGPTNYLTYDEMLYYLEEGYKLVRGIDPIHPVYIIECWGNFADTFERSSQMCDIFAIDPYPHTINTALGGTMTNQANIAIEGVSGERPIWVLGLASAWGTSYGSPENYNSTMLRYQLYEALWAGAKGAGHYVTAADTTSDGKPYEDVYLETFRTANETGEVSELFDHFSFGNSEVFAEGTGDGYRWRSWYKDNGDIYLALQTKLNSSGKVNETTPVSLNLISSTGKFAISGFDALLVNGKSEKTVSSVNSTFSCTLPKGEVSLYKIIPVERIDFTKINSTKYDIIPLAYGENIVANGDCEAASPSGFAGCSNTNYSRTNEKAKDSTYSVKLTPKNTSSSMQLRAYNLPIDRNSYYEVSFSVYSEYFDAEKVPQLWLTYRSPESSDYQRPREYFTQTHTHNGVWKDYRFIVANPAVADNLEATTVDFLVDIPAGIESCYFDNISIRKVTDYKEDNLLTNISFESLSRVNDYVNTSATGFYGWGTASPANIYITDDAHTDNFGVGVKNTSFYATAPVEGGKTYLFSTWFNANELTSAASYPSLKVQAGNFTSTVDFTNAFDKKAAGWHLLSAEFTIPDSVAANTRATVSLVMTGTDIGYFDDATFGIKGKTGYTLRNLKTTASESSITVEYDINSHFTEEGGTIIYVFYDADGRYLKMEKEAAAFTGAHITRTFDKVDFASMKVFVWDNLGGLIPYSNVIE
ncbi:MAG: carbohydrate binding domain-containing protein [Clostridia bacterium]|nr:carbohydrate binding domain-containing protein [Clostridia bacterium]